MLSSSSSFSSLSPLFLLFLHPLVTPRLSFPLSHLLPVLFLLLLFFLPHSLLLNLILFLFLLLFLSPSLFLRFPLPLFLLLLCSFFFSSSPSPCLLHTLFLLLPHLPSEFSYSCPFSSSSASSTSCLPDSS